MAILRKQKITVSVYAVLPFPASIRGTSRVKIEFNINVEQFLNGIDSINECATYELPMAQ